MRRAARRFAFVILLLSVAAVSILGTLAWVWAREMAKPAPPLLSGLLGMGSSEQNVSFLNRIRQRFPIGSTETALAHALQREGFAQIDWGGTTGSPHQADWKRDGFPCMTNVRVTWTADSHRRITSIDGFYGYACL
jgi:hypothetical protein